MKPCPRFSVVIPTYNRANYLKRSLDAILAQAYPDLELIVIDGGSTDGTVELLKSYGGRISRWVSERDQGEYFAVNKGIGLATGSLLKLMTDDDVLRPGALQLAAGYFGCHPDVDVVFGSLAVWREEAGVRTFVRQTDAGDCAPLTASHYLHLRGRTCDVAGHFMRRSVFERFGLFSTEYVISDREFWVRLALAGGKMVWMPEVVMDYVLTGSNGVTVKAWRICGDYIRINRRYGTSWDVLRAAWTWGVLQPLTNVASAAAGGCFHALGLHPMRAARRLLRPGTRPQPIRSPDRL